MRDSDTASQQPHVGITAGLYLQPEVVALSDGALVQCWSDLKRVTTAIGCAVERAPHPQVRRQEDRGSASETSLKASAAQFS